MSGSKFNPDAAPACAWPRQRIDRERGGMRWYLLSVFAKRDKRACELLEHEGFEPYYPMMRSLRPIPRRLQSRKQRASLIVPCHKVEQPMFPGYLFARFDLSNPRWHGVFDVAGVRGLVAEGGLPTPMPSGVVEGLQAAEINGAIAGSTPVAMLPFAVGDRARIDDGPFAGHNGTITELPSLTIDELDESARVRLLVDLFGRAVPVELAIGDLQKA
jgi:transcription antitermination factor NusG